MANRGTGPKRQHMYYGWWIVIASFATGLYVSGVVMYGFTAIVEPVVQEFGWSYASVSVASSLRGAETGLLAPLAGMLVDRWGARPLVFLGGIATAGGLFLLSKATSLSVFYGAFALMAVGLSCCTATVLVTTVNRWFRYRAGLATGIAVSGFGMGGLMLPLMVSLISQYGWRDTIAVLALGALVLLLPVSVVFRPSPPEPTVGADGVGSGHHYVPQQNQRHRALLGHRAQAPIHALVSRRAFWFLALAFTGHGLAVMTITAHIMPYLSSIGLTRTVAGLAATGIPLLSVAGRLGLGWASDRVSTKRSCAAAYAVMGIGACLLALASWFGLWTLVPAVVLFGLGYGGIISIRPVLIGRWFGMERFGSLLGLFIGIGMTGAMAGPPLAGWLYDTTGEYSGAWFVLAAILVVCGCLVLAADSNAG